MTAQPGAPVSLGRDRGAVLEGVAQRQVQRQRLAPRAPLGEIRFPPFYARMQPPARAKFLSQRQPGAGREGQHEQELPPPLPAADAALGPRLWFFFKTWAPGKERAAPRASAASPENVRRCRDRGGPTRERRARPPNARAQTINFAVCGGSIRMYLGREGIASLVLEVRRLKRPAELVPDGG
eukprot:7106852-Pyramimonas_sp.AAC.1